MGKFSCRRLCPPPVVLNHRYGAIRGILLDFLLSRSKSVSPRTQKKKKKKKKGEGEERYIIRGVARKFNDSEAGESVGGEGRVTFSGESPPLEERVAHLLMQLTR